MSARSNSTRPVVLLIDDDPASVDAQRLVLEERVRVILRHPSELRRADLQAASVILVDYRLTEWSERDGQSSLALRPLDGVAVAAVLRSYADGRISRRPRVYAIHSGNLSELSGGLPAKSREHAIARTLNLEWVFGKGVGYHAAGLTSQVMELADGVSKLPDRWPANAERADLRLTRLLAVPQRVGWRSRALADVQTCRPPAHAWALATNGTGIVRWLLHEVLPFPCFLLDIHYLAARLRVSPASLRKAMVASPRAARALAPCAYSGIFRDFVGTRWWRAGIEHLIWSWTKGDPFNPASLQAAVAKYVSPNLEPVIPGQPVVTVDAALRPSDALIDIADAVEVQPDGWPSYAEPAWIEKSLAEQDDQIRTLVVARDRGRLQRLVDGGQ